MKAIVCVKAVPDTETRIKIGADGRSIDRTDVKFIISPYDEYALEEGLKLKEAAGGGEVVIVSFGGDEVPAIMRECLARGADRAIHVKDAAIDEADTVTVGKALAAAIKPENPDIVLCGTKGVGGDNSQIASIVAEYLGIPQVTDVTKMQVTDRNVRAEREIEGGHEVIETQLPVVISAQKGLNEPRYATLKGIMAAKKKPIDTKSAADLGLTDLSPKVRIVALGYPPARPSGRIIPGDPDAATNALVDALHNEAKVI
ncbi:MAG TPA: electron transfer flavoprotein subunit beta/FixA family protein [Blastocatellia bacterium]|nr:electron transfer flavoprotein subunit beta/FixA family protein [Blastocatellia bacterium]